MDRDIAGTRVFIVEDEPLVGLMLEEMLGELGVAVSAIATKLEEALLLAEGCDFNAAVLDVNLSGAKSYPVADKLRARGIPFAFATGYGSSILTGNYRHDRLIHKPYSAKDIECLITDLMRT